jgi:pimeloyl-ACP methyl ester carboxylesterase
MEAGMTEFLTVAGGRTAYDISRPPVLLTSGLDDVRQASCFLAPQLTGDGYRAAVTDMRGHGEASGNWPSLTRSSVAGRILALIDHLGGPAACGQLLRRYPGGIIRRFSASGPIVAMPVTRRRPAVMAALGALALLVLPGCSSGGTTSAPAKAAMASPSPPASQTYASKNFVVPFTITVGASLKSPPHLDSHNLLFWDAANSSFNKVRFLVPTNLYRPGSFTSEAPPKDYLTYLQGLTSHGVKLSNVVKTAVDGHPATLMTATSSPDAGFDGFFDGTLGCPNTGADQAEGCYGIQPDLALRISVIRVGNTTLLAWARTSKADPDKTFFVMFERMLKSARFR